MSWPAKAGYPGERKVFYWRIDMRLLGGLARCVLRANYWIRVQSTRGRTMTIRG